MRHSPEIAQILAVVRRSRLSRVDPYYGEELSSRVNRGTLAAYFSKSGGISIEECLIRLIESHLVPEDTTSVELIETLDAAMNARTKVCQTRVAVRTDAGALESELVEFAAQNPAEVAKKGNRRWECSTCGTTVYHPTVDSRAVCRGCLSAELTRLGMSESEIDRLLSLAAFRFAPCDAIGRQRQPVIPPHVRRQRSNEVPF